VAPLAKAGVGSAVNDTTRELGGALGVAVVGSILASLYRTDVGHRISGLPATAHGAAASLGAALQTAKTMPGASGATLANAARHAYVHAFDATLMVTVIVAILASSLVWWVLRPAPAVQTEEEPAAFEAA
jgi:hypothetical protein